LKEAVNRQKSDLILDELKRRTDRGKIVAVDDVKVKLVIFSLHREFFAFYGEDVKEILPLVNIYSVPGSPDYILGVINIRGDIESVININRFLGLDDAATTKHSRIAVAQKNGIRSGILIDSVVDFCDIPVCSVTPALSTHNNTVREFVAGELFDNGRNITLLDIGKIFARMSL
jgi:purine-binding chemotaxis protein CheW